MQNCIVTLRRTPSRLRPFAAAALMTVLLTPAIAWAAECRLRDGPMTIFRSGTLDKVHALGKENYPQSVLLYAACASVPTGTKLGMLNRGFFTSTVIVKEGHRLGCTGDLENEFIACD